jgi:2-dehydropantoate 2-reductase
MRRDGLTLKSALGDVHIAKPKVPKDLAEIGSVDCVLFCVKLWDVDAAAVQIKPLMSRDTGVVPFQNGVGVCDRLAEVLGPRHVLGGVAKISATIEAPGTIRHNGSAARLILGERDGAKSQRVESLSSACDSAGIEHVVSGNIERDIWEKFVFLAPLAGASCFYRAPIKDVVGDPQRREHLAAMMRETAAVGRAKGIALTDDLAERTLKQSLDIGAKPSMLVDLENGRRLELEWLNGEIVRLGKELGVPTPANAAVYEALKPHAMGGAT